MTNPLNQAGAVTAASHYAPIYTNRFITGLWTQRNPLRDAAMPFLTEKSFGPRMDSLIDGRNIEVTSRLTLARRPGHSVYNSQVFPAISRFYGFRIFSTNSEIIKLMADSDATVWDATGPATKTALWTKSAGAGTSYFQSVGNILYFGNGVDQKKWVQTAKTWGAAKQFQAGDFIVDPNNNIQAAVGAQSAEVANVDIAANVATVTFTGRVPLKWDTGVSVTFGVMAAAAFLNGLTPVLTGRTYNQITFALVHANYSAADSGTVNTTSGLTGGVQPAWPTGLGAVTIDGGQQWMCKGSAIRNWGINSPLTAPTVNNAARPTPFAARTNSTYYAPSVVIVDSNGNLQLLTTAGTTGAGAPVWAVGLGATTADNTAVWTNMGPGNWAAAHAYVVGDVLKFSYTYWVTIPPTCFTANVRVKEGNNFHTTFGEMAKLGAGSHHLVMTKFGLREAVLLVHDYEGDMIDMGDGELVTPCHKVEKDGEFIAARKALEGLPVVHYKGKVFNLSVITHNDEERHFLLANGIVAHNRKDLDPNDPGDSYQVTVTGLVKCTTAGISGGSQPSWVAGVGSITADGTAAWTNIGGQPTWATVGANKIVSLSTTIIDGNGNKQTIIVAGTTAAAPPVWATASGASTVDGTAVWINGGAFSAPSLYPWLYSYAFKDSVTGHVSTAAPLSNAIVLAASSMVVVQGEVSSDFQADIIEIYRTAQNGSTLLVVDQIPVPTNSVWSYSDTTNDAGLSVTSQAQINNSNDPPPAGLIGLEYHLGRIFGFVGNTLYRSNNGDTINGKGDMSFPPANNFIYPSAITRTWSTSIGLLVFTKSDIFIVLGQGTASSPFYSVTFLAGIGLLSYDAFAVFGSTAYLMTSAAKVISLDPGAGVTEPGFPIGDQFSSTYNPSTAFLAWHEGSSGDTGLYVADAATGWFRMSPTSAPETGAMWSPRAVIAAGCKAISSVETAPGTVNLLVGPGIAGGQILKRDLSVYSDNGATYEAWGAVGNIVLAHSGVLADIEWITTESIRVGKRLTVGLLLGEISGTFDMLAKTVKDPPLLPESDTLFSDRYTASQTQTHTFCHHLQLKFLWEAEAAAQELLSFAIYGAMRQERRG